MLKDFHFLYPLWLIALPPVWALAAWCVWRHRADTNWASVIDPELLPSLRLASGGRQDTPWVWIVLAWTLAVLALAGPAWERDQSSSYRVPGAWVLLLDLSPTMAAADLPPDRATRARYALNDLLDAARDQRVALLAFAGEPHVVTPLTIDVETVRALLPPLSPALMPVPGANAAPALGEAGRLLKAASTVHGEVILFADGVDDPAAAMQAAQRLRAQGIRLNVVGIGSAQGGVVPDGKGGFSKAVFAVDSLQGLAAQGGGEYVDVSDLPRLIAHLQSQDSRALTQGEQQTAQQVMYWHNGGAWLLLPLLGLTMLLARRGWL